MNDARPIAVEFWPLLDAACDGCLTDRQREELEAYMEESPEARRAFVEHIRLRTQIHLWAKGERLCEAGLTRIAGVNLPSPFGRGARGEGVNLPSPFGRGVGGEGGELTAEGGSWKAMGETKELVDSDSSISPSPSLPLSPSSFPPSVSLSAFLPTTPLGNVAFSYAMSAVLVAIGLFIFSLMSASSPRDAIVKNPIDHGNQTTANIPSPTPEPELVSIGRITGMVDCVWADPSEAPFHNKIKLHDKFALKSGLLEITYHTGAKVILQGPCTYEVESPDGGYLSLGKLTARVESRSRLPSGTLPADRDNAKSRPAESRPAGGTYFAIRTPTAIVTDLGTEFGVEVEKSGETQSHVYRGRIELRVLTGDGNHQGQVIPLGENESARVTLDKRQVVKVIRNQGSDQANQTQWFVRDMPKRLPIKLFNTGVGIKEGDSDPHWQLVARSDDPKFKPRPAVVVAANLVYRPNDAAHSQWISLAEKYADLPDHVTYTFRTTFDLDGLAAKTAVLQGHFIVDDCVTAIRLNGKPSPLSEYIYTSDSFQAFWDFTVGKGFVDGTNTLEFDVFNGDPDQATRQSSPMAIRVELEGTCVEKADGGNARKRGRDKDD